MKKIVYRPADYADPDTAEKIKRLYAEIFHCDMSETFSFWYGATPFGGPLGVLAVDAENGEAVGHFGTVQTRVTLDGRAAPARISMGFMVSPRYRGYGIATRLNEELFSAIAARDEDALVIGFPNDVSFHMHITRMGYRHIRDFQFVTLPRSGERQAAFAPCASLPDGGSFPACAISHAPEYLAWRYAAGAYDAFRSERGSVFVCSRFRDKADILWWSAGAGREELLDFAAFLYRVYPVERVCTWNTFDWLDAFPKDERHYHFCIHPLPKTPELAMQGPWTFFMGDCELF